MGFAVVGRRFGLLRLVVGGLNLAWGRVAPQPP